MKLPEISLSCASLLFSRIFLISFHYQSWGHCFPWLDLCIFTKAKQQLIWIIEPEISDFTSIYAPSRVQSEANSSTSQSASSTSRPNWPAQWPDSAAPQFSSSSSSPPPDTNSYSPDKVAEFPWVLWATNQYSCS